MPSSGAFSIVPALGRAPRDWKNPAGLRNRRTARNRKLDSPTAKRHGRSGRWRTSAISGCFCGSLPPPVFNVHRLASGYPGGRASARLIQGKDVSRACGPEKEREIWRRPAAGWPFWSALLSLFSINGGGPPFGWGPLRLERITSGRQKKRSTFILSCPLLGPRPSL